MILKLNQICKKSFNKKVFLFILTLAKCIGKPLKMYFWQKHWNCLAYIELNNFSYFYVMYNEYAILF